MNADTKEYSVSTKMQQLEPSLLCLSCITEFEIEFGFSLLENSHKSYPTWYTFKHLIKILPFTREESTVAAHIRSDLTKKGKLIGAYDLLIAATAKRYDLVCVTDNFKEFSYIENLKLENWRKP